LIVALKFLHKRFWLLLAFAVLSTSAGILVMTRLPPQYEASATVLVHPGRSARTEAGYYLSIDQIGRTIAKLMTRRPLLARVIQELDLSTGPTELAQRITVAPYLNSQIIAVKVRDRDPDRAARIANKLVADYVTQSEADQKARFGTELQNLQTRINEVNNQIKQTQLQIAELQARPRLTPEQQGQLGSLQTKLAADSAAYSTLAKNYDEIQANQANRVEAVTPVEPAAPPREPLRSPTLIPAAALLLGLLAGTGLGLLLGYLDNTLKTMDAVRTSLGLPTLGTVPRMPKAGKGPSELIAATAAFSPAAEAFRGVRTNILFAGVDRPVRSIVVTSSVPGEGKTLTAANLAVVMAQAARRVVLVDADFRRPRLPALFRRDDTRGITNLLIEKISPADILWSTDVPNLRLLCTGAQPLNPSEILSSRRMGQLITYLQEMSDIVIYDSPPLNAVTDPAVLASRVDGAILVVEAGRTPITRVSHALEALSRVEARILGVVLNKVKEADDTRYKEYYKYHPERTGEERRPVAVEREAARSETPPAPAAKPGT